MDLSQLSWRLRFKSFASEVLISTQLACDDLTKDFSPFDCLCIFKILCPCLLVRILPGPKIWGHTRRRIRIGGIPPLLLDCRAWSGVVAVAIRASHSYKWRTNYLAASRTCPSRHTREACRGRPIHIQKGRRTWSNLVVVLWRHGKIGVRGSQLCLLCSII